MADTPVDERPSDADIMEAARSALHRHASTIYLSRLGQDLRQVFGANFKIALGTRSLGDFMTEHLGDSYEVWGKGPYKRIGVLGSAATDDAPPPREKYPDALWRAFGTPVPDGCKRWVTIGPPLLVEDREAAPDEAAIEVSSAFIVANDGRSRRERAVAIGASIRRWAEATDIAQQSLVEPERAANPPIHPTGHHAGAEALRQLIAIIPEGERAQYSLPMDLLWRLLQVS